MRPSYVSANHWYDETLCFFMFYVSVYGIEYSVLEVWSVRHKDHLVTNMVEKCLDVSLKMHCNNYCGNFTVNYWLKIAVNSKLYTVSIL